jgi:hypothetical protein
LLARAAEHGKSSTLALGHSTLVAAIWYAE